MTGRPAVVSLLLILTACAVVRPSAATTGAVPYARCAGTGGGASGSEPAECIYWVARSNGSWDEARNRLDELLRQRPRDPWVQLYLARTHVNREDESSLEEAERFYRQSAAGFAAAGEVIGEFLARQGLRSFLFWRNRVDEAEVELERALALAAATDDETLALRAQLLEANHLWDLSEDMGRAYRLLRRAHARLLPDGPYELQVDCLILLGNLTLGFGRPAEALRYYQRSAELSRQAQDTYAEANARYNMLLSLLTELSTSPREGGREEVIRRAEEALEIAEAAHNWRLVTKTNLSLGDLMDGPEAESHYRRCAEVARRHDSPVEESACLGALARHLARQADPEARDAIDRAMALALDSEDSWRIASAWSNRMQVSWNLHDPEVAWRDSESALDALESFRDLQYGDTHRAELFSLWVYNYYWLSGRLFEVWQQYGSTDALDRAFATTERMRSRILLEVLDAADALPQVAATEPLRQRRTELLAAISRLERRLLDRLSGSERVQLERELWELELAEEEIQEEISRLNPKLAALARPDFATLDEIRSGLAPDEALLSYQVAAWENSYGKFAGGSWLTVVTRQQVRVHRLPDIPGLGPAISLFLGLFQTTGGREAAPAARLYGDLLEPALANLPPEIDKLVLVPDGILHHLPFDALRPAPDAPPLALRYQITRVPSATLWLRWRRTAPEPPVLPALVLADPVALVTAPMDGVAGTRGTEHSLPARLGPLPYARTEGRRLARHLGKGTLLLVGEDASEELVKAENLRRFGILHFAAHAETDDTDPKSSTVWLAPGTPEEDGKLQFREIADLELCGQVVVLSACRSASGQVLRGEGVLDLARAFFQAGAHVVVGSLWRLRDDDAAIFFDTFYRHIARGASVAEAANAAQRERIDDGAPAAAWAGLVVLGNGELVPLPGGRPRTAVWWWVTAAVLITLVAVGLVVARWRQGGRYAPPYATAGARRR